jgi:glycosyltransferase involved in cell wall biosynthesis
MNKILVVCNADFTFNKFLIPLVNQLVKQGFSVGVVCDGEKIDYDKLTGQISFYDISIPRKISLVGFISAIISIRNVIIENQYKIVNSNNRNASFFTRLAIMTMPFAGVKNIYTARGMYFHDSQGPLSYLLTYWLEVFLLFFTDMVMSQSEQDVNKMTRNFLVNSSKLKVIHNGIDIDRFSIKNIKNVDINFQGFVLCTVGRIAKGKGLIDLLEAFSIFSQKHSNSTLLIIGGVLHRKHNKVLSNFWEKAEQLKIKEKIFITGLVDNVQDYLAIADVYIHPSYREGVPRSVLEAMSLEKVVIATNIRGASEILESEFNGILYQKGDIKELSRAIERVSLMTQKQRSDVGLMARKRVLDRYTEKAYINRQLVLLSKLKEVT